MKFLFITILLCLCNCVCGQEIPSKTQQQIENLSEALEEEPEDDSYLQEFDHYIKNPLNINTVSKEELQVFRFLTDLQIENFIRYRALLGNFISLYELQAIPGWDVSLIQKILPFISLSNNSSFFENLATRLKGGENSFLLRATQILERAKGYDPSLTTHYLGGRQQFFLRYKYQFKNLLKYGIVGEKDAGEQFFRGAQSQGFDFYSAHLFARNIGIIKAIAIGDYSVNMGQGLIQWQSLAFKKSADVLSIKRQSSVLRPYNSSGEFYFNRGAGITIQKGKVEITTIGSIKKISGNIFTDISSAEEGFSSFLTSGLHRTTSEIADRNNIRQTSIGGTVRYAHKSLAIGVNGVHHQFSKTLQKRDGPYNLFALNGKSWTNFSSDYSYTYKNIHLFGELATDKNLNYAFINGLMISLDPKIDMAVLYRNINKDYAAVYGNAFTENLLPSNESGLYIGISIKPINAIRIDAYSDIYKFPWLKYRVDAPGKGQDYLLQLTYQPNKEIELYTRYRVEAKDLNESIEGFNTNVVLVKPRQNWRFNLSYKISRELTFRTRSELLWYDKKGKNSENGFLVFAEGLYKYGYNLSANMRIQYFETEGFNSGVYAYENDVLYSYSIPPFFDKGFRYYINVNYDLNKNLSFWFKWAQTIYRNKEVIGSGLDEISGNRRSQIKLQARILF